MPAVPPPATQTMVVAPNVAPAPVPHPAPVVVPGGTPAGPHSEAPKVDKPAAAVLRAPGDVPAK